MLNLAMKNFKNYPVFNLCKFIVFFESPVLFLFFPGDWRIQSFIFL